MKLFVGKKKSEPRTDLDHLTPEGELPYGWYHANRDFADKISNEYHYFFEEWIKARKIDVRKEYAALKSLIIYTEDIIRICAAKGECFAFWASVCVSDPKGLAKQKERLQYMEENMQQLIKEEEERRYLETVVLPALQKRLLEIIKETPGIVQSSIYKLFDADMKNHIQLLLYNLDRDDIIKREKCGRSYKLYLK